MRRAIDLATVANVNHCDGPRVVVDFVDDPVAAEANPPTFAARQFLTAGWPWILLEFVDLDFNVLALSRGQRIQLFPGARRTRTL
jgi:hypothetical protein